MRKRTFSVFIIIYMMSMFHTYALAFTWQEEVKLGEPILIYHNDTLIYNITIDVNKADNLTYALVKAWNGTLLVKRVEWNSITLGNISIVSTKKDLQNKTAVVIISGPDEYRVVLQGELQNPTASNVTVANQTNTTTPAPANLTNTTEIVIPQNISNLTPEQCQKLIRQLEAELNKTKQEKAELEKQIQYLQQQLNMTRTENEQLKKQIKILEQALEEKNRKIAELEEEIQELQKQQWSWKTFREKSEEQYLLWTPYFFPVVLAGLVVYYRRYKTTRKYAEVMIDQKARELKEELLSEYLKKDLLKAKIDNLVTDPNLLVILRTIIPQITGSTEITKGDILNIDIDQVAELARKKFLLKENRIEYLKKKLAELKEQIKEEVWENV